VDIGGVSAAIALLGIATVTARRVRAVVLTVNCTLCSLLLARKKKKVKNLTVRYYLVAF
jgi:hypothetical protein